MSFQSKTKRKSNLKADVVMRLFLQEAVDIRNLTKRIHELDRKLAREFVSFNRISESIEKENNQIRDLLLEPIVRVKRLEKARSQQQCDLARSFETEEKINRLLEARSDAISDIVQRQHELGKVR
jgi:predicted HTH domain antitoxin